MTSIRQGLFVFYTDQRISTLIFCSEFFSSQLPVRRKSQSYQSGSWPTERVSPLLLDPRGW